MTSMPITAIIVWSYPRTRSTVLERYFMQHPDCHVLHEPMSQAYFWGKERVSLTYDLNDPSRDYTSFADASFDEAWNRMTRPPPPKRLVVTKEHAKFIFMPKHMPNLESHLAHVTHTDDNPTFIDTQKLLDPQIRHVFLLRDPEQAIRSWARLFIRQDIGMGYLDYEQIGIHQSRKLYDFLARNLEHPPLILNSEDMLDNPSAFYQILCQNAEIPFHEEALTWEPIESEAESESAQFHKFGGWHDDALSSSRIDAAISYSGKYTGDLPPEVAEQIQDNMDDYAYLRGKAHRFQAAFQGSITRG